MRILRELWRSRLIVVAIYIVAMLAGLAVACRLPSLQSRQYHVGAAEIRLLVDTPASQVVDVAPKGSDTLASRATLLANLMVDGVVKDAIAKRAGLRPSQLAGISDTAAADLPTDKASAQGYMLTTKVVASQSGDQLPIVDIQTQARDVKGAVGLANAAVSGLDEYLNSRAAQVSVPPDRRLRVTSLGPPQAATVVRGPSKVMAVMATVFTFFLGCALLLGIRAVLRDWRATAEEKAHQLMGADPDYGEQASLVLVDGDDEDEREQAADAAERTGGAGTAHPPGGNWLVHRTATMGRPTMDDGSFAQDQPPAKGA